MSTTCETCGAALAATDKFCNKCGARRSAAVVAPGTQCFCIKCGALLGDTNFCIRCGAPANAASAISPITRVSVPVVPAGRSSSAAAESPDAAYQATALAVTQAPPSATLEVSSYDSGSTVASPKSSVVRKLAITITSVVLLMSGVFAGVFYVEQRARQKASQLEARAEIERGLGSLTAGASSAHNDTNSDRAAVAAAASAPGQGQAGASRSDGSPGVDGGAEPAFSTPGSAPGTGSPTIKAAAAPTVDTALTPPPIPGSDVPIVPVAATGDQAHDWALEYERSVGGPEADLVVRTGDINNLGFGWPPGFDPFSGQSTPIHPGPNIDRIPPNSPPGTDRIILGTGLTPVHMSVQHTPGQPDQIMVDALTKTVGGDGYSWSLGSCFMLAYRVLSKTGGQIVNGMQLPPGVSKDILQVAPDDAARCTHDRQLTMPTPIVLMVGALPTKISAVVFQIFADDFQSPVYGSHFQIALNDTRIPNFEYAINSLNQSGPIGKLVSLKLLPEYWPLLKSGTVKLSIDDPTSHVQDGFAVDFVRILVNPHDFKYQVSLTATVTDASSNKPIVGAMVTAGLSSALTDGQGKCALKGIPAGLVVATANAPGYDENSVPVDLPAGQSGNAEIHLRPHQESTAALEQSIAQTGTATVYGIHFDTGSSKLRADSMPALNAVLGLINGRPGSKWIIAGHTDNQGSDALNIPLSKARAASVVSWLTAHGIASDRLEPEGFGSTRPVADNATANGRALNRRVEILVTK